MTLPPAIVDAPNRHEPSRELAAAQLLHAGLAAVEHADVDRDDIAHARRAAGVDAVLALGNSVCPRMAKLLVAANINTPMQRAA